MQFSDTTNRTGLIQDCEFLTNLGDAKISGNTELLKHFTRNINLWYYKVWTMILESQDGWDIDDINLTTNYAVATTPLVADQRDYTLPASLNILKVKRIDICYDGTGNTCYRAEPIDINEIGFGVGNDTDVDARFNETKPFYDLKADSIWIYPRADADNVTNGGVIRMEFSRKFDEFTTADTTQSAGFDEPFDRMLSIGASFDYALVKGMKHKNDLFSLLQDYETRLKKYYSRKNEDRNIIMKGAYKDFN